MKLFPGALSDAQAEQITRLSKRGYRRLPAQLYSGFMFEAWVAESEFYPRNHGTAQQLVSENTIISTELFWNFPAVWEAAAIELLFERAVREIFSAFIQMYLSLYFQVRDRNGR